MKSPGEKEDLSLRSKNADLIFPSLTQKLTQEFGVAIKHPGSGVLPRSQTTDVFGKGRGSAQWLLAGLMAFAYHGDPGTGVDATGLLPFDVLSSSFTSLKE